MIRIAELKLTLAELPAEERRAADAPAETEADRAPPPHPVDALTRQAAQVLGVEPTAIARLQVFKRSFDARKAELLAVYIVDVELADPATEADLLARHAKHPHVRPTPDMSWTAPGQAPAGFPASGDERPVVVGFGPCGLFAALALAQMGFKPIVLERGKPVRERTRDTWALWRRRALNPQSNVQFGEGGAGLFSDGKLYSQIKDPRFLGRKVMREFVEAGAPEDILTTAHPHIGTFKLVKVVEAMREKILALGGEIRFQHQLTGLITAGEGAGRRLRALRVHRLDTDEPVELPARRVVLALGHSARDTFAWLWDMGVAMEAKPFSVGFRIEHPQSLIDRARWGRHAGHPLLGAADYKLVHHAKNGRAVYSFCMCPGGTVVAATSEPGRVVTNGMSQYSRAERNANSGLVVGIEPADYPQTFPQDTPLWTAAFGEADGARYAAQAQALRERGEHHPLAGVVLQRQLESRAYELGGRDYSAPGQRVGDFLAARPSTALGEVEPSYKPGIHLTDLAPSLPAYAIDAIREALPVFGRQIRGYDLPDALLTGVETRTSSPLRLDRDDSFQSPNTRGLYPAGEGAGYAGGILSAGVDGLKVAEALARELLGQPPVGAFTKSDKAGTPA
ncbi:MAG: FAD-dependent oxidoreductase [Hydrogenophaga sp.]|uniref:NAD(P)/FAD-dependent oxidoreductase n=1 Tax=Hydrogenophaga sp. TaxID=1904254 RepID=UPI0016AE5A76|nr:FAD-dependent oxidoreductase [Hydrogenophaga sp.]NIM43041.1 FAD-dependent oxidoreductase [Hydrogenophaga sp.]NIN28109.1 FAD-dependent oxidoreductase [Hydrogenophaga sp.]NIN30547.1 FAD-dependent oxidoreductase [Hydrogenophaga sp.]NIN57244.1 FAD-dependent oxidoreductase [Hydrogenophaga sp.]NIO51463.1 FAD-dependent oxidoreductase [Hydrogenophaga sp.]